MTGVPDRHYDSSLKKNTLERISPGDNGFLGEAWVLGV